MLLGKFASADFGSSHRCWIFRCARLAKHLILLMADSSKPEVQDGDDSRTVHLVSGEGETFDVPLSVAKMSELVKTMITEDQDDEEVQEIPLPNVKSSILAKVIVFAQHYKVEAMTEIEKVHEERIACYQMYNH